LGFFGSGAGQGNTGGSNSFFGANASANNTATGNTNDTLEGRARNRRVERVKVG
jgi:hypothetical protein